MDSFPCNIETEDVKTKIFFSSLIFISLYLIGVNTLANDYKLNFGLYRQKYEFSCEAAALTALLNYDKILLQEDQIIKKMPIDPTQRTSSVWGDPTEGFVGDIYGKNANMSYGIHWQGLQKVARQYGTVDAGVAKDYSVLITHLLKKRPVIAWVISENSSGLDLTWKTPTGKTIKAVEGEHTVIVYGFRGNPKNPIGFYIMDPNGGFVFKPLTEFEKNWKRLGNSYLAFTKTK